MMFDKLSIANRIGSHGEKCTGLSMMLTHDLIEAHGGTIAVTSEELVGTKITVHLPLIKDDLSQDLSLQKENETIKSQSRMQTTNI